MGDDSIVLSVRQTIALLRSNHLLVSSVGLFPSDRPCSDPHLEIPHETAAYRFEHSW
jgi:hypothetical protein